MKQQFAVIGLGIIRLLKYPFLGKIIIIILMFVGRLGPLTIAFALTKKQTQAKIRYPEEKILIG